MKLDESFLSPDQVARTQLSQALATAGQALMQAAAILDGKRVTGFTPVGPTAGGTWLSLIELVNEFLLAKARAGRSDRYLGELRVSLKNFASGRARCSLDQVKAPEIEKWMFGNGWAPKTMLNYLGDLRTMFNYAVRRGYLDRNPAAGVEPPVQDHRSRIEVHTPEQVRTVLEFARAESLDVCRHLAVRYFAGVRSAEAFRLRETDLKLDQGLLEVPATKAKTRSRRLVKIEPNLRAWLDLGGELRALSPYTVYKLKKRCTVPWKQNAARHSFVSYHVAKFGNAGRTALEAGTSEQMVFKHYRALVTPGAAEEFWSIKPKL